MKYFLTFILLYFFSLTFGQSVKVPFNISSVEIDGFFKEKEWAGAKMIEVGNKTHLFLKQDKQFIFLGIKRNPGMAIYVDFYLKEKKSIRNLHASMQLGERELTGEWNDSSPDWQWGNNKLWSANSVRYVTDDESIPFLNQINEYEGYEFKIDKTMITSKKIQIMIEIRDFMGEAKTIIYPEAAKRDNSSKWGWLKL